MPGDAPGWWPVISGVFLAYLWALLVLSLLGIVMDVLGVVTWPREAQGAGWLGGPFEPDGPWSMFADAFIAFTVLAFTSFSVVWTLSDRLQLRVSWVVTFAVLCVTGYVPFFFFEGRLRLSGLLGLLVSAALIRWSGSRVPSPPISSPVSIAGCSPIAAGAGGSPSRSPCAGRRPSVSGSPTGSRIRSGRAAAVLRAGG